MTRALLLILILAHLFGPTLAEAPMWTVSRRMEWRMKRVEAVELWAIRKGIHIDRDLGVWR